MNGYDTGLNGILRISKEDYEEISKDSRTLYCIHDTENFSVALGNLRIPFFRTLTQEEYDELETPDANTLYLIRREQT